MHYNADDDEWAKKKIGLWGDHKKVGIGIESQVKTWKNIVEMLQMA